jgi:hypothetical protein
MKTDFEILKDWWEFMTPKRWLQSILLGIGMVANMYIWVYVLAFFNIFL